MIKRTPRDNEYLAFVRLRGCAVCGRSADAHHVDRGGMGMKGSDYSCIPLCRIHHQEVHSIGDSAFEERFGVSILRTVAETLHGYLAYLQDADGRLRVK